MPSALSASSTTSEPEYDDDTTCVKRASVRRDAGLSVRVAVRCQAIVVHAGAASAVRATSTSTSKSSTTTSICLRRTKRLTVVKWTRWSMLRGSPWYSSSSKIFSRYGEP